MMKKLVLTMLMFVPVAMMAQKFGHTNFNEIVQAMPEFTKAKTELETLQKQYESDLKSMQDELQRKSEAFQKEESTLPEGVKKRREQELQEMYQKIQQSASDNQQSLQKAYQEKMEPIQSKILDAVKAVGQAGNYVYIMDLSLGIPYISNTLSTDVTSDVKSKLGLK